MKRHLPTLLSCGAAISCAASTADVPATPPTNLPVALARADGVSEAVTAYFRASDEGASRALRVAFHPAAHLQWVDETGELKILTQLEWWERIDSGKPVPADRRTFEILDREGRLALVEAVSRWPTHTFDDLLLVVQTPEGWRIVGKVFEKLGPGATATGTAEDVAAIRAILATKIEAHASYDPRLLARSHTPHCQYVSIGVDAPFTLRSLSEAAARYAGHQDRGETDRESPWRILSVTVRGHVAAAKLDVIYQGRRYIDHLLLVRPTGGWRIAAAAWGDPT